MTLAETMVGVALVISAANLVLLFATYRRAGAWKEGEEAKELIRRLDSCVSDVAAIKGQGRKGDALEARLAAAEGVIGGLGVRMENVATKADISRLTTEVSGLERLVKSEVAGIERHVKSVEGGVERIEGFLMNTARGSA